jgi:hypothetical protein
MSHDTKFIDFKSLAKNGSRIYFAGLHIIVKNPNLSEILLMIRFIEFTRKSYF